MPNTFQISLKTTDNDDPEFVDCISRILNSLVDKYEEPLTIGIIHIDNWFDRKWLGFEGKELGAIAVRWNWPYNIPPFHPNRVLSQTILKWKDHGVYEEVNVPPLHIVQKSTDNFRRPLFDENESAIYAWWSGESKKNIQASLMIYSHVTKFKEAWFASFKKKDEWELTTTLLTAREYVLDLMEHSNSE